MNETLIHGILGGLMGSICMGWICFPKSSLSHPSEWAVVDIATLISRKAQQAAHQALEQREAKPSSAQNIAKHLKTDLQEELQAFAKTHNLVLLTKSIVVGGDIPDKTEEILAWLQTHTLQTHALEKGDH